MDRIKVEELPTISYTEGKIMDQQLGTAHDNLTLLSLLSVRILQTGRLSDEINLLVTMGDVTRGLSDIEMSLLSFNLDKTDKAKVSGWPDVSKIANGPANAFYVSAYEFVMTQADSVQDGVCSAVLRNCLP